MPDGLNLAVAQPALKVFGGYVKQDHPDFCERGASKSPNSVDGRVHLAIQGKVYCRNQKMRAQIALQILHPATRTG
jgi:hypothetical protein